MIKNSKDNVKKARPKPKVKKVSTKQIDKFKAFAEANCDLKQNEKVEKIVEKLTEKKKKNS